MKHLVLYIPLKLHCHPSSMTTKTDQTWFCSKTEDSSSVKRRLCSVWRSLLHWASRSSTGTQAVAPSCTPCLSLPYAPCHWPACVRLWWSPLTHIYILIRQSCFHHHRHHHHSCTVECLYTDTPQPSWPPGCTKRIVFFLNFPLLGWGPFPTRNTILQIHHHIEPWFRRKIWPWC